jgi:hypothetical protein
MNNTDSQNKQAMSNWQEWIPKNYLRDYYQKVEPDEVHTIRFLVDTFKRIQEHDLILEFGSGPTLHHIFAAVPYFKEIHMADYIVGNLEEAGKWVAEHQDSHDWSPFIRYTLECEGITSPTESDVTQRVNETRVKITKFIQSDANQERPLGEQSQAYPVVLSCYCADSAVSDKDTWRRYMKNITSLVKPGGHFVTAALRKCKSYKIGDKYFPSADIDENDLREFLELDFDARDITIEVHEVSDHVDQGYTGIILAHAIKRL